MLINPSLELKALVTNANPELALAYTHLCYFPRADV
jgi:hypothetical protein